MLQARGTTAREGDVVLLYRGYRVATPLRLITGALLHVREGIFAHDDIIGQPLGRYVKGRSPQKLSTAVPVLLVLQSSADMWTQSVPHRTQIIYDTDIAVIVMNLRLQPGRCVIEAGTGSGSLTHSLAKAVAPHGRVYTCDFHKSRCLEAQEELRANGLSSALVRCQWRDVCQTSTATESSSSSSDKSTSDNHSRTTMASGTANEQDDVASMTEPAAGFGLPAASVDAVFLDIPAPWLAMDNVRHVLRENGMLCTFSPCIEQTQRTAEILRAHPYEFIDIRTVEALSKSFDPVYKRARACEERSKSHGSSSSRCGSGGQSGKLGTSNTDGSIEPGDSNDESVYGDSCVKEIAGDGGDMLVERMKVRFRPSQVSKGHSAYLTFARRRLRPRTQSSS